METIRAMVKHPPGAIYVSFPGYRQYDTALRTTHAAATAVAIFQPVEPRKGVLPDLSVRSGAPTCSNRTWKRVAQVSRAPPRRIKLPFVNIERDLTTPRPPLLFLLGWIKMDAVARHEEKTLCMLIMEADLSICVGGTKVVTRLQGRA